MTFITCAPVNLQHPAGDRCLAEFVFGVILETQETHNISPVPLLLVLVQIYDLDLVNIKTRQTFRPAVRNRLRTLDGVKKVLAQAFLFDFLGPLSQLSNYAARAGPGTS